MGLYDGNTNLINIKIDSALSSTSENPVQNKIVYEKLHALINDTVQAIDSTYSSSKIDKKLEELAGAFKFKGYISLTQPTGVISEGALWFVSSDPTTTFPWACKKYSSGAWSSTASTSYNPEPLNLWTKVDTSSEVYYHDGTWKTLDPNAVKVDNTTIGKNASSELMVKDNGITTNKIYNLSVTTEKINTSAITTAKIEDEAITKAKINPLAKVVYEEDTQTLKNKTIEAKDNTLDPIIEVATLPSSGAKKSFYLNTTNNKLQYTRNGGTTWNDLGGGEVKAEAIAPKYDATQTYTIGSIVMYEGKRYKCISAITTPEAWTSAHWNVESVQSGFVKIDGGETKIESLYRNNSTGELNIYGGNSASVIEGGQLTLFGKNSSLIHKGGFRLRSSDGVSNYYELVGNNQGQLTWRGETLLISSSTSSGTSVSTVSTNWLYLLNMDSVMVGISYDGTNLYVNNNTIVSGDTFSIYGTIISWSISGDTLTLTTSSDVRMGLIGM